MQIRGKLFPKKSFCDVFNLISDCWIFIFHKVV